MKTSVGMFLPLRLSMTPGNLSNILCALLNCPMDTKHPVERHLTSCSVKISYGNTCSKELIRGVTPGNKDINVCTRMGQRNTPAIHLCEI